MFGGKILFSNIKRIHFIGIGGVGMSGIAHVLKKMGKIISGSDSKSSLVTERLISEGISVFIGHQASNVQEAELVVISTAIHKDNLEYQYALTKGIKVVHRSDLMAYIVNSRQGVAIAGAHGKTSTTSMIAYVATMAQQDPTYLIGGDVALLAGNAHYGSGCYAITEADESDGSFLKLQPYIAVVTNIEDDHLDFYKTKENINKAFTTFLDNVEKSGEAIICYDNSVAREVATLSKTKVISYAIDSCADFQAREIVYAPTSTSYKLYGHDQFLDEIVLKVPGRHNVLNSLAAIVATEKMGIELQTIKKHLAEFNGAKRRFEIKYKDAVLTIVDDYGHHPTEIKTTLKAALQTQPQRLICVFQPHRYTRTQLLFEEFVDAFVDCDLLVITDIYAAGENEISGISADKLVAAINKKFGKKVEYISEFEEISDKLLKTALPGDLIITMGAGNIYNVAEQLTAKYTKQNGVKVR